ncbi:MAG: hypothetical protein H7123_08595 [Thermoleophilia bacterium]|nr:hypothetical protein [Thermoleophilia bacterium]
MTRLLHPSIVGNVLNMRAEDTKLGGDPVVMRFEFHAEDDSHDCRVTVSNEQTWDDWDQVVPEISSIASGLARENGVHLGQGPRFETELDVIDF